MLDKGVLAAIGERCDDYVKFIDLVEMLYAQRSRKVFICVGEHGVYFVKRSTSALITGGELHFAFIEKFVEDLKQESDFVVVLKKERPKIWTSDQIWLRSFQRKLLINYVQVAWQSDYMFRYGRVGTFPRYRSSFTSLPLGPNPTIKQAPPVVPFLGFQEMSYEGYSFFLYEEFKDRITATATDGTGNYIDSRGFEVAVHVHDPLPVIHLDKIGRETIKATAADYRKDLTERSHQYQLILNNYYNKKMNLVDDPSSWTAWEILCRTADALTMVIILRRNYTSPLMDMSQEVAVVFRITAEAMYENSVSLDQVVHECHLVADSMGPSTTIHPCYRDLLQYKLDALMFDEEGFQWFSYRLKMSPSILPKCKSFAKTLLVLLDQAGCLKDKELIYELGEKTPVEEGPIVVLNAIVRNGEGFDVFDTKNAEQLSLQHRWQQRCARYIGFLLDGFLTGGKLRLSDIASCVGYLGPQGDQAVRQILDFLLHVRSSDWTEPFMGTFIQKITSRVPTASITYNDKVMTTLVESGYIGTLFPKGDEAGYIRFISLLLRSPASSSDLKSSICRQVLKAAGERKSAGLSAKQQDFLMGVVPSLLTLVKSSIASPLASEDVVAASPFLSSLAVSILVTLSAGNMPVKALLLNAGIAQAAVSQLRQADFDLRNYTIKLSINLTKTAPQRQRFLSAGVIPALVDILVAECDSPHESTLTLLHEICALIGQFANETDARDQLVNKYPTLECLFYLFHTTEPHTLGKSRIIFALRQLAQINWQTRQRIGYHVSTSVLHDLRTITSEANYEFIVQSLSLLLVLATFKPHCFDMQENDLEGALTKTTEVFNVSSVIEKIQQLRARVAKNTKRRG